MAGVASVQGAAGPAHGAAAAARAALWNRLADLTSYPAPELVAAYASGQLRAAVEIEVAALPYDLAAAGGFEGAALAGGDPAALESDYLACFELPGESGAPCPLYAGVHHGDRRQVMEELLRFYRHFGLTVADAAVRDLPDAVPTVCEFLGFLAAREATVEPAGQAPLRAAQRDVLDRHLAPASAAVAGRLAGEAAPPFYRAVTALLAAYAAAEVAAL